MQTMPGQLKRLAAKEGGPADHLPPCGYLTSFELGFFPEKPHLSMMQAKWCAKQHHQRAGSRPDGEKKHSGRALFPECSVTLFFNVRNKTTKKHKRMKLAQILAAAMIVCSLTASASNDFQLASVECTQINADHVQITCKMSDKTELSSDLINYDVKNSEGTVISSGYGTNVFVDNKKLQSEEEYTIVVYAIVNGNAVSQSVARKAPVK
jgi:hypothetical protein